MALNTQKFIEEARKNGIPDKDIYNYLQKQQGTQQQEPQTKLRESSGGFLGYVAPILATPGQTLGLLKGAKENLSLSDKLSSTLQSQSTVATNLLKSIQNETDEVKKQKLKEDLNKVAKNSQELASAMNEIASNKGLTEATKIKIPYLVTAPGLETDPGQASQQVLGRSIRQIGVNPALGAAGAGSLFGAGKGLEEGRSPLGIAGESAKNALLFKGAGFAFGKLANTQVGKNILTSPIVSTVLKVSDKIYSPFMPKLSAPGTYGADVDKMIKGFGDIADKFYSPTTYLKSTGKVLNFVGEKVGLVGTPEKQLAGHKAKITKYWSDAGNKYQNVVRYDKGSPEFLGEEGVIPKQVSNSMSTGEQATLMRQKGAAEHSLLNKMLEKSGVYVSTEEARRQAANAITNNFKGVERELAIKEFNKQFDSLISQNQGQVVGDGRIPIKLLNDMKSYMWSQGYSSKIAPKSEQVISTAMRVSGNSFKNYINTAFQSSDPAMAEAVININEHSGKLFQSAKFLDLMNGKKLPYGVMGRYFARITGAIIGSSLGPMGSVVGTMTADQLVNVLQNPEITVGKSALLISQLKKTNPKVVEDALRLLNNMDIQQVQRLQLSAPTTSKVIPLPQAGVMQGQENIKPSNLNKGEIPQTTDIMYRGEGSLYQMSRNSKLSNMLGEAEYWSNAKDVAGMYGNVREKVFKTFKLEPKDIFIVNTQDEYTALVKKALFKYPMEDTYTGIPKYLKGLGYKAGWINPKYDPLGGLAIFK